MSTDSRLSGLLATLGMTKFDEAGERGLGFQRPGAGEKLVEVKTDAVIGAGTRGRKTGRGVYDYTHHEAHCEKP